MELYKDCMRLRFWLLAIATTVGSFQFCAAQTAVIDTTMGRLTCKLMAREAPKMTANFVALAEGSADWKDPAMGEVVHGKPFYDGTALAGISAGITGGDRAGGGKGTAGDPFPVEHAPGAMFDLPGRLAMKVEDNQTNASIFLITTNASDSRAKGASVFGQCDDASVKVAEAISHLLLTSDNHPETPVGINHIAIVREGEPMPAVAANVPADSIVPRMGPLPASIIPVPEPTGPTALIETTMGTMNCRLFDETPVATGTFIKLVEGTKDWKDPTTHAVVHGKRFYDGLTFNRVIPDFMIQNQSYPGAPDGNGDIGINYSLESVPGLIFDRPGRMAIANSGPDKMSSQFFITEHPVHRLDEKYTIFGQCDDASVKVVEEIARLPRNGKDRPDTKVVIRRITIVQQAAKP
jgi:cyclophilin family peptidyl-prolyl cis-trans isomerase